MAGAALLAALASLPGHRYAVLDGAHFDDLPAQMKARGLAAIPLYLEAANGPGVKAGPHLASVEEPAQARAAIELIGDRPAATFWSWPGGSPALRRHLRGLNLAEIPDEQAGHGYESVLFRHWDPNVLAVTLPVLRPDQQSRFLGDAQGLLFDANEHAGITTAPRPAGLPRKSAGLLRFEPEQIAGITAGRMAASHRRIAGYLREVAPDQTARIDQRALLGAVVNFDREARELGLAKESDIARWAFLQVISGGGLFADPDVRNVFGAPDAALGPTERMDALMEAVIDGLRAGA